MWIKDIIFDSRDVKQVLPNKKYVLFTFSYIRTLVKIIKKCFINITSRDEISRHNACYEPKAIFYDSCLLSRQSKLKHVQKYAPKDKDQHQQRLFL